MTPIVELRRVARRFPQRAPQSATERPPAAVEDVSLELLAGEVLTLLGPSGCGKSTTLRLIAGHDRPDAGDVWVEGRCVASAAPRSAWVPPERRRIGMVFQDYALFPHLTVAENVAYGLRGGSRVKQSERVDTLLSAVGMGALASRRPHQLSGGQQQRVALARAMAPRPAAILLDEPFNTLDAHLREQVRGDMLALLREERVAVLLVTHDQDEAMTSSDRVAVMRAGRIEQVASPTALYNRPATRFVAEFVGEGTFVPAVVTTGRVDTPFGAVAALTPESWLHAEQVSLLVRPEEVEIEADASGNAVIAGRRARGSAVEYDLRLRPDPALDPRRLSALRLHVHAAAWLREGTPVQVRLSLRHLVAFSGERAVLSACVAPGCTCPEDDRAIALAGP
ncbi:MAG: ABC transporter ATP-binding protein [Chloroflexota bacterium]